MLAATSIDLASQLGYLLDALELIFIVRIHEESLRPPHEISQGTVTSLFSVKCSFVNSLRFSTPKRLAIVLEQNEKRLLKAKSRNLEAGGVSYKNMLGVL